MGLTTLPTLQLNDLYRKIAGDPNQDFHGLFKKMGIITTANAATGSSSKFVETVTGLVGKWLNKFTVASEFLPGTRSAMTTETEASTIVQRCSDYLIAMAQFNATIVECVLSDMLYKKFKQELSGSLGPSLPGMCRRIRMLSVCIAVK